jgi:dTMP kinase
VPAVTAPFITFEGADGVGKSTQIRILAARLQAAGMEVLCLREPGGTRVGEAIRGLLLNPEHTEISDTCELLLYEAARAQLVEQVIAPALAAGTTVLCDRFADSTTAYQGCGRGLDDTLVEQANALGSRGLVPARTIVLTRDVGDALEDAIVGGADRLEAEGVAFQEKVNRCFEQLAKSDPGRVRLVAACEEKADTAMLIFEQVADLFDPAAAAVARAFEVTPDLIGSIKGSKVF